MMKDLVFEWRNHSVRIKMTKSCDILQITEKEELGPFKEGEEVKLPYWQAKILVNENYAKFVDLKTIQTGDLHKVLYRELPNPQLTAIDPDFYVKIHEDLLELTEQYKKKPDLRLLQKIEKIKSLFRDVISRRFYKLLRIAATAPEERSDVYKNCTNEEKVLLESLRKILEEWETQFLI
ncbi:MAG: hypothetical protein ACTSRC_00720 [Candidatus Helarchaeota archaeon]